MYSIGDMDVLKIRKSFKFKLKMTDKLEKYCILNAGHTRFVWNYFLRINLDRLNNKSCNRDQIKKDPSESSRLMWYYDMGCFTSNILKKLEETAFLKEAFSGCLNQKLKDLHRAFKDFFNKKLPDIREPVFKNKRNDNSFRFHKFGKDCKLKDNKIRLPKFGWATFFKSREITGTPKNLTIRKDGKDWFFSIQCEEEISVKKNTKKSVGIDLGVKTFATCASEKCSDNYQFKEYGSKNYGKKYQDKKAKLQRKLANKVKFSNNWKKQNVKINKVTRKIKNCRHDYIHKVSTEICKNHAKIYVENLKVANMTKSAKGTVENPGKNVKQKSGLNKSILDQGWGMFREMLEYKANWNGGEVIKVAPQRTSQQCHKCGHVDAKNRKTQKKFECLKCKNVINADRNAAINILTLGQRGIACEVSSLVKRIPAARTKPLNLSKNDAVILVT